FRQGICLCALVAIVQYRVRRNSYKALPSTMRRPIVRVLFCSGPLYGHVNSMLPLALAAHRSGHEVVFATGAGLVAHVERYGLEAWEVGAVYAGSGTLPDSWLRYFAATAAE